MSQRRASRAGELARPWVRSLSPSTPVGSARERLRRWDLSCAPIVDRNGHVLGGVSRELVERASRYGLTDLRVEELLVEPIRRIPAGWDLGRLRQLFPPGGRALVAVGARRQLRDRVLTRDDLPADAGTGAGTRGAARAGRALAKRLDARCLAILHRVGQAASAEGFEAYLVGGVVRDLQLGRATGDLDVMTEGDPAGIVRRLGGAARTHRAFHTASLGLPDGTRLDLARSRQEHYRHPGSLPEVEPSTAAEDLSRRDFTINAMALRLGPDGPGELLDPFDGRQDLRDGVVRVLHGLSMVEDPTRAFRAVRLATRLGLRLEPRTRRQIGIALRHGVFGRLSAARVRREIELLLSEPRGERVVRSLAGLGLLGTLSPGWRPGRRHYSRLRRLESRLAWYGALDLTEPVREWVARLGLLILDWESRRVEELLDRLRPGRAQSRILREAPSAVARILTDLSSSRRPGRSETYRNCEGRPVEILLMAMAASRGPAAPTAIAAYLADLRRIRLDITGHDLLNAGVRPGPAVARGLRAALAAKLDGRARTRAEQVRAALTALGA